MASLKHIDFFDISMSGVSIYVLNALFHIRLSTSEQVSFGYSCYFSSAFKDLYKRFLKKAAKFMLRI